MSNSGGVEHRELHNAYSYYFHLATFDGHVRTVTAISFPENGYFHATTVHDGV